MRYASSEDIRVDCSTHGLLNSNYSERPFMIWETLTSAQGARRLGGLGACPPPPKQF